MIPMFSLSLLLTYLHLLTVLTFLCNYLSLQQAEASVPTARLYAPFHASKKEKTIEQGNSQGEE